MIKITIPGPPGSKGRARVTKWGAYTPEKTVNYENLVKYSFIEQCKDVKPLEKAIGVHIHFYMPIPKSASKKNKILMALDVIRHTKKPDLTNMIKAIEDGLNGFAYIDDSQIVIMYTTKRYSEEPRVEVTIVEIKED